MRYSNVFVAGLLLAASTGCNQRRTATEEAAAPPLANTAMPAAASSADKTSRPGSDSQDVAECSASGTTLSSTLDWVMRAADSNGDGRISRSEADALAKFLVGGFMYRTDTNGDGVVTPAEARNERQRLAEQHPELAALLTEVRRASGTSPFRKLADLLDVNYGKPVTTEEARGVALSLVGDVYQVADLNHDGFITQAEAEEAARRGAAALGDRMFRSADANGDGVLDEKEFQKPVDASAQVAFKLADKNDDGKLSKQEAESAFGAVIRQLGSTIAVHD